MFISKDNSSPDEEIYKRRRITTLQEALLDDDPLMTISGMIDTESEGSFWFRLMFAGILEVNSAGPGIMLDRYSFEEVKMVVSEYARIGAHEIAGGMSELIDHVTSLFGRQPTDEQIMTLSSDPVFQSLDRKHTLRSSFYRDEMEKALIAYIRDHPGSVPIPATDNLT